MGKRVDEQEFKRNRDILLSENERCELCGSRRGLEVHHIIPKCCGGTDGFDNLIVVCSSCHTKLTPRSICTKIGIRESISESYPKISSLRLMCLLGALAEDSAADLRDVIDAILYCAGVDKSKLNLKSNFEVFKEFEDGYGGYTDDYDLSRILKET